MLPLFSLSLESKRKTNVKHTQKMKEQERKKEKKIECQSTLKPEVEWKLTDKNSTAVHTPHFLSNFHFTTALKVRWRRERERESDNDRIDN